MRIDRLVSCACSPIPTPIVAAKALRRCREYVRQPLQIQQPAHQIGFVADLQEPTPLKAPKAVPTFRLTPQFFDLLPGPLREAVAHRPAEPPHPLMDGLSSGRLGGNVRGDASSYEGAQERLGKIPLIRTDR